MFTFSPQLRNRRCHRKVCKYCGRPHLRWVELKSGWRLYRRNQVHSCEEYRLRLKGTQ